MGTVLAYVDFLFEEGAVGGAFVDHYISAVRTRHQREGYTDPCYGAHLSDLIRAFKREDENRGELKDVRATLSGSIIAMNLIYGLSQPPGSVEERNEMMIEIQCLVGWRESTARSVQVRDVMLIRLQHNHIQFTAITRTWKGIPVRGVTSAQLTCRGSLQDNPLSLQLRYFHTKQNSPPDELYFAHHESPPSAQFVTLALNSILGDLSINPPRFSFYASHNLRSGATSAMVLLGVPIPVIVTRGGWKSSRMVKNIYFDGRLHIDFLYGARKWPTFK